MAVSPVCMGTSWFKGLPGLIIKNTFFLFLKCPKLVIFAVIILVTGVIFILHGFYSLRACSHVSSTLTLSTRGGRDRVCPHFQIKMGVYLAFQQLTIVLDLLWKEGLSLCFWMYTCEFVQVDYGVFLIISWFFYFITDGVKIPNTPNLAMQGKY